MKHPTLTMEDAQQKLESLLKEISIAEKRLSDTIDAINRDSLLAQDAYAKLDRLEKSIFTKQQELKALEEKKEQENKAFSEFIESKKDEKAGILKELDSVKSTLSLVKVEHTQTMVILDAEMKNKQDSIYTFNAT